MTVKQFMHERARPLR